MPQRHCLMTLAALLLLATAALATRVSNFGYLSNGQVRPEGSPAVFGANEIIDGRVHINGSAVLSNLGTPLFLGFYSQTEPFPGDVNPVVFPGGWSIPHAPLDFDFEPALQTIRGHCLPSNHWRGREDSLDLTTVIKFEGSVYHAAQYVASQFENDTLYHIPWTTYPLPDVIWVEGVARVSGIVSGQVTLLAGDSLFIMDNLITEDVILGPCGGDPPDVDSVYGTVPPGSPNRIGLISEKDIIIAATLQNGWANGMQTPIIECGLVYDSNRDSNIGNVCQQGRRDVIVTAAILALGCSFECEFWKTTAWGASVPPPTPQVDGCGGHANTEVTVWDNTPGGNRPDCLGADWINDRRGTLWFCGSLAVVHPGFLMRSPAGPWGNASIGYQYKAVRYDPNLLVSAPPWWPDAEWITGYMLDVQPQTGTASVCGVVDDPLAFEQEWSQGAVRLRLRNADLDNGQALVLTRVNGQTADSVWVTADVGLYTWWTPTLDLSPWLNQDANLFLEVQLGEWAGNPPQGQWDVYTRWNADGSECAWVWGATGVEPTPEPAEFRLGQPWPNPFNPSCQMEVALPTAGPLTLEVFDLLGRREAVVFDDALPAGAHAFTLDGSSWPAGLHLLCVRHSGGVELRKLLLVK